LPIEVLWGLGTLVLALERPPTASLRSRSAARAQFIARSCANMSSDLEERRAWRVALGLRLVLPLADVRTSLKLRCLLLKLLGVMKQRIPIWAVQKVPRQSLGSLGLPPPRRRLYPAVSSVNHGMFLPLGLRESPVRGCPINGHRMRTMHRLGTPKG